MSDTKARIYVPTAVNTRLVETLKTRMADEFGGYTVIEARGGWVDEQRETIEENVEVLECTGADERFIKAMADWIQVQSSQDAVMWEIQQVTWGVES